ncbi:hypothetical protein [Streptomyces sp. NBC_01637]|uniref:hypothetical protein n=1 Tax=unclassified Streptomyces TaxID=2593676 RepID=UPI00386AB4EA|nr:hypothetical protein OH719_39070 [Streptomyces sp. NBC_01653]WTD87515.1 hypothetical protein OG891_07795 [Streptomyces sp. NBC_01637]
MNQSVVGPIFSLTDVQGARVEPLLPGRTLKRYGSWRGVYSWLRMWAIDGTWEWVFTAPMAQADAGEDLNWAVLVDSTIVRAHRHAAGAHSSLNLWQVNKPPDRAAALLGDRVSGEFQ